MDKVVIVDDARVNGIVLQGYVQSLPNVESIIFTRPMEALDWCGANPPDLVLLDYYMPDIDGVEFLRHFRCAEALKDVPVVMVTGEGSKEALYLALNSGATDFLRKPVDRVEFVARARNMLELRRRQRALLDANEKLSQLATTDALTGVKSRRAFLDAAENELQRSKRYVRPFSVAVIDVDHFKAVNDTYGHDVGDKVLQVLARICSDEVRSIDPVGRLGGEEFAVLFPEMALPGAVRACERLLDKISKTKIRLGDLELGITVSAGLAECAAGGETVTAILKRADTALYAAKKGGRNRVEMFQPEEVQTRAETAAVHRAAVRLQA